jgi:hypothetical protein
MSRHPGYYRRLWESAIVSLRQLILTRKGCGHSATHLWHELNRALVMTEQALGAEPGATTVFLHTGDLSQAGQIDSMRTVLNRLRSVNYTSRNSGPNLAIPGNHDLWPGDFPVFSVSRTVMQFQQVRDTNNLPTVFPEQLLERITLVASQSV